MKARITLVSSLLCIVFFGTAYACGESLYRVGKGVTYREYTAPLPGYILVYAPSAGTQRLADALRNSGHDVHMANSPDDLAAELQSGSYDVVIAPFNEQSRIDSATVATRPSFLPIAFSLEDLKLAKQTHDYVMVPDQHELKHYLKAIHKTLKRRS